MRRNSQKLWKIVSVGIRNQPPQLKYTGESPNYDKNIITIPSSFITWLREIFKEENFEKALTLSIAHELQHHLQALGGNCWIDWQLNLTSGDTKAEAEAEADYKGIISTYLLGYNDMAAFFEEFMKKIYAKYNISDKPDGYPHLVERKQFAEKVVQQAKQDWIHFEVAKLVPSD
ncbi:MAG: hypothetical protein HC912_02705 [Saprospiraceae bacterium]|nr:hypothetical protein [Saprospiraceae bacterium]